MAYTKTNWVNGSTPINDTNLNHIEDGIYNNDQAITGLSSSKQDVLVGSGTEQNIKTINNLPLPGTGNINVGKVPLTSYSTSNDDTYSCNYINSLSAYSTSETVVGRWIDGKPLYRKVVEYTLTETSGYPYFDTGIQNPEFVKMDTYFANGDTINNYYQYIRPTGSFAGYLDRSNNRFTFILAGSGNTSSGGLKAGTGHYIFVFEYTKTTD